jgi:hypothetical protein
MCASRLLLLQQQCWQLAAQLNNHMYMRTIQYCMQLLKNEDKIVVVALSSSLLMVLKGIASPCCRVHRPGATFGGHMPAVHT